MLKNNRISVVLLIIQLLSSICLATVLIMSRMIPMRYIILAFLIIVIVFAVSWVLMFRKADSKAPKTMRIRRIIASLLTVIMLVTSASSCVAVTKVSNTISGISESNAATSVVGVYVLKNDSVDSIKDAADYSFGYTKEFDSKITAASIRDINQQTGVKPDTRYCEDIFEMVKSLYKEDVNAIILNEAVLPIIEEQLAYKRFEEDTKLIYEYQSETEFVKNNKSDLSTFVIYLCGSDTRHQILDVSRNDVNILMAVNTKTKEILLVNTPRDYYVPIAVSSKGEKDKLTHCCLYGVDCSMDTLSNLYGQEIDYYAQINFEGFKKLVDYIGGVAIHSDIAFSTSGVSIKVGENHLNGAQTLAFARERKILAGGDNDRGKNQMKVLMAIIDKLSTGTAVKNFSGILKNLEGMLATNMSSSNIASLVKMQLDDMAQWDVHSYAVTGTGGNNKTFSMPSTTAYVMYPNQASVAHASELIDMVLSGEKISEADLK